MNLSAQQWLVILIGLVFTVLVGFFSNILGFDISSFGWLQWFILFIIVISAIIFVVYKRIGEIDKGVDKLNEKLKTKEDLDSIELDIKNIYWILEHGK